MVDVTWADVAAERTDFTLLCETLELDMWDLPTSCGHWRVRDVVGHVIRHSIDRLPTYVVPTLRHRLDYNRTIDEFACAEGRKPVPELLERLRSVVPLQTRVPLVPISIMMADTLVHGIDIRRATEVERDLDSKRLAQALDAFANFQSLLRVPKRIAGLSLVADDVDWQHGSGPVVNGPGSALLEVMCGRPAALDELAGDGLGALRDRLGH